MKLVLFLSLFLSIFSSENQPEWFATSMHYWPFDNIVGKIIRDHKGSNHGRLSGNFRLIPGIVGSALSLTGSKSFLEMGQLNHSCLHDPETCTTGLTIMFWLKMPVFKGNKIILQLGKHRFSRGFTVWTRSRNKKMVGMSVNTRRKSHETTLEWDPSYWTHLTIVWKKSKAELQVYFNCTLQSKKVKVAERTRGYSQSPLVVGANSAKQKNTPVMVDEFAIWNDTLTKSKICSIFKIKSGKNQLLEPYVIPILAWNLCF